ncbi:Ectoine hydrolase (plasmid) [Nitratireductor thuwali]|uniref:Ectoine hydrolase n=1 Tax=Nitratireductor thuwali TaxID=2267699 RepID=A0ABY5MS90_9HYPH|nr:Ectoine hydrolase [Nitratireductor thuwali]
MITSHCCSTMRGAGYDAFLLFKSEDMYWLTGLDTDGFYVLHAMLVTADGKVDYLGRQADYNNVFYSSILEGCRVFDELAGSSRGQAIKTLLQDHGLAGGRIGIQYNTMGHRADLYVDVVAALEGWCSFSDASPTIDRLRLVKSPAEIEMMRKSANIVQLMTETAIAETRAGVFEGKIFGALAQTIYENDGDPCALRYPIGCGPASKLGRYTSGRHHVADTDQFMFEIGCGYRHYHTAIYFHVLVGDAPRQRLCGRRKVSERVRTTVRRQVACPRCLAAVERTCPPSGSTRKRAAWPERPRLHPYA